MILENIVSFVRSGNCVACEVMEQALEHKDLKVSKVWDIDSEEGLNAATRYEVNVTPTYMNKITKTKLIGIVSPRKICKLDQKTIEK